MATPKVTKAEKISKKTRRELQEYFVGTSLRIIGRAFDDANIDCDFDVIPTETGERRGLVQRYYATLDFSNWEDVRKFLLVYAGVLVELEIPNTARWLGDAQERLFASMKAHIQKDGFEFKNGTLVPIGLLQASSELKEEAIKVDAPYLLRQIERIENEIDRDPRLAIGTSKELVETVCKTILTDRGVVVDRKWELMDLVKRTREELKLVPDEVPDTAKASDTIRKLLGNLGSIVQSLAELRNSYGTGHGHDGRSTGLSPRHARLAAGAACVLAKFLFETNEHHS